MGDVVFFLFSWLFLLHPLRLCLFLFLTSNSALLLSLDTFSSLLHFLIFQNGKKVE